jgi:hypothetical protein
MTRGIGSKKLSYYGDSLFPIYQTKRGMLSFKTQYLWPIPTASVTQIDTIEAIKANVARFCQRLGRYPSSLSWSLARCSLSIASSRRIGTRTISDERRAQLLFTSASLPIIRIHNLELSKHYDSLAQKLPQQ